MAEQIRELTAAGWTKGFRGWRSPGGGWFGSIEIAYAAMRGRSAPVYVEPQLALQICECRKCPRCQGFSVNTGSEDCHLCDNTGVDNGDCAVHRSLAYDIGDTGTRLGF